MNNTSPERSIPVKKKRRSSILKAPVSPEDQENVLTQTKKSRRSSSRRVSFARLHHVKEFAHDCVSVPNSVQVAPAKEIDVQQKVLGLLQKIGSPDLSAQHMPRLPNFNVPAFGHEVASTTAANHFQSEQAKDFDVEQRVHSLLQKIKSPESTPTFGHSNPNLIANQAAQFEGSFPTAASQRIPFQEITCPDNRNAKHRPLNMMNQTIHDEQLMDETCMNENVLLSMRNPHDGYSKTTGNIEMNCTIHDELFVDETCVNANIPLSIQEQQTESLDYFSKVDSRNKINRTVHNELLMDETCVDANIPLSIQEQQTKSLDYFSKVDSRNKINRTVHDELFMDETCVNANIPASLQGQQTESLGDLSKANGRNKMNFTVHDEVFMDETCVDEKAPLHMQNQSTFPCNDSKPNDKTIIGGQNMDLTCSAKVPIFDSISSERNFVKDIEETCVNHDVDQLTNILKETSPDDVAHKSLPFLHEKEQDQVVDEVDKENVVPEPFEREAFPKSEEPCSGVYNQEKSPVFKQKKSISENFSAKEIVDGEIFRTEKNQIASGLLTNAMTEDINTPLPDKVPIEVTTGRSPLMPAMSPAGIFGPQSKHTLNDDDDCLGDNKRLKAFDSLVGEPTKELLETVRQGLPRVVDTTEVHRQEMETGIISNPTGTLFFDDKTLVFSAFSPNSCSTKVLPQQMQDQIHNSQIDALTKSEDFGAVSTNLDDGKSTEVEINEVLQSEKSKLNQENEESDRMLLTLQSMEQLCPKTDDRLSYALESGLMTNRKSQLMSLTLQASDNLTKSHHQQSIQNQTSQYDQIKHQARNEAEDNFPKMEKESRQTSHCDKSFGLPASAEQYNTSTMSKSQIEIQDNPENGLAKTQQVENRSHPAPVHEEPFSMRTSANEVNLSTMNMSRSKLVNYSLINDAGTDLPKKDMGENGTHQVSYHEKSITIRNKSQHTSFLEKSLNHSIRPSDKSNLSIMNVSRSKMVDHLVIDEAENGIPKKHEDEYRTHQKSIIFTPLEDEYNLSTINMPRVRPDNHQAMDEATNNMSEMLKTKDKSQHASFFEKSLNFGIRPSEKSSLLTMTQSQAEKSICQAENESRYRSLHEKSIIKQPAADKLHSLTTNKLSYEKEDDGGQITQSGVHPATIEPSQSFEVHCRVNQSNSIINLMEEGNFTDESDLEDNSLLDFDITVANKSSTEHVGISRVQTIFNQSKHSVKKSSSFRATANEEIDGKANFDTSSRSAYTELPDKRQSSSNPIVADNLGDELFDASMEVMAVDISTSVMKSPMISSTLNKSNNLTLASDRIDLSCPNLSELNFTNKTYHEVTDYVEPNNLEEEMDTSSSPNKVPLLCDSIMPTDEPSLKKLKDFDESLELPVVAGQAEEDECCNPERQEFEKDLEELQSLRNMLVMHKNELKASICEKLKLNAEIDTLVCNRKQLQDDVAKQQSEKQSLVNEIPLLKLKIQNAEDEKNEFCKKYVAWAFTKRDSHAAEFAFLSGKVKVDVRFGKPKDIVEKVEEMTHLPIQSIEFDFSKTIEGEKNGWQQCQVDLFRTSVECLDLKSKYLNKCALQEVLQELSLISVRANQLYRELRFINYTHDVLIKNSSYEMMFTSFHKHLMFSLTFHADLANYPHTKPTVEFNSKIGNMSSDEASDIISNIPEGPYYIKRCFCCIEKFMGI